MGPLKLFDPDALAVKKASEEAVRRIMKEVYGQPNRRPLPSPPQDREKR